MRHKMLLWRQPRGEGVPIFDRQTEQFAGALPDRFLTLAGRGEGASPIL